MDACARNCWRFPETELGLPLFLACDMENPLTNSTTSGTNITMLYNGDDLRVAKSVGSTTTHYYGHDSNGTVSDTYT